jgi:cell division protein FtsB
VEWQNILGIAAVIVAIGSVAGVGLLRDRLSVLKDSNDELRDRITDLENERARDKVENAALKAEVATLSHDADVLRSAVRDRANYETISSQVDEVLRVVVKIDKRLP